MAYQHVVELALDGDEPLQLARRRVAAAGLQLLEHRLGHHGQAARAHRVAPHRLCFVWEGAAACGGVVSCHVSP